MYFPVVLLAMVSLTCVAADVVHDVSDCPDSSLLCDRLGQLEHQLTGQSRLLSQQHDLLLQLQSKLSDQEDLNRQQDDKLSQQENLVSQQNRLLRQLQSKLSQQEQLNRHQELKLSQQASLVQQLRAEKARDSAELKTVKGKLDFDSIRDGFQVTPSLSDSEDSVISPDRGMLPRADDQGPLDAVVSHMGQQLTEMSADIQTMKNTDQTLKNTIHQQDQAIQDAQSSTFVHWGSSQCSNASQLVYSGIVGGSFYDQQGGATNYLCLTMSPVFSDRSPPIALTYLYGAEYDTSDSHQDKDPVCAVCRSRQSATIMIPGTDVCTPGWQQHYNGFLMAGNFNHPAGSEFICVDAKMDSRPDSSDDHNGKLLFFTVAQCGSLPCEPYVSNKLVTCVVCSK